MQIYTKVFIFLLSGRPVTKYLEASAKCIENFSRHLLKPNQRQNMQTTFQALCKLNQSSV